MRLYDGGAGIGSRGGNCDGEHSLGYARAHGFRAMQFNFVVNSNQAAIHLWEKFGFATIGLLPGAFLHPRLGYVDALVMYRTL